jgi:hypothetical protein
MWVEEEASVWIRVMTHLVDHDLLVRANTAVLLTLVCGGLAACAAGAAIYDFGRTFGAW